MSDVHYIQQIISGNNDPLLVNIRWNNARLIVHVGANPCADAAENHLVKRYEDACRSDDGDEEFAIHDEILTAIEENGTSIIERLAPPSEEEPSDLHSIAFPPEFEFKLVTVAGKWEFLPSETYHLEIPTEDDFKGGYKSFTLREGAPEVPEPRYALPKWNLDVKGVDVPTYITSDIQVVKELFGDGDITHARVDGRDVCAKIGLNGFEHIQRELECLAKITSRPESPRINVPKLLGLVKTPGEDGHVIGILETLIPLREAWELASLRSVEEMPDIPKERKEKWVRQMRSTVDWLHGIGVVWGGGKTDNVLIHRETDDAWVVDFGEGRTVGWADEGLEGTVEGDEQAVKKIVERLGL